jgi:hypothetical protein
VGERELAAEILGGRCCQKSLGGFPRAEEDTGCHRSVSLSTLA